MLMTACYPNLLSAVEPSSPAVGPSDLGTAAQFVLSFFTLGIVAATVVTWSFLARHRRRRGQLLTYEPRVSVPWGPIGLFLAGLFVLQAVAALFASGDEVDSVDIVYGSLAAALLYALTAATIITYLIFTGATWRDFGLPATPRQFWHDCLLGGIALGAAFPVYIVQALLVHLTQPSQHPLLQQLQQDPDAKLFLVAIFSACIVAPVFEEFVFRLLLQGWLEKVEDAEGGTGGVLPHGWRPILFSSALFALAHLGHGPDPVALFLLAIFLGYLYQRTHRILPSIVLHSLFNACSIVVLWLALWVDAWD